MQFDVLIRNRKTGDEKLLPEAVYDANIEDLGLEWDFIQRVEIKDDHQPTPKNITVNSPTPTPAVNNQQALIEEVLKLREENRGHKATIESLEKENEKLKTSVSKLKKVS